MCVLPAAPAGALSSYSPSAASCVVVIVVCFANLVREKWHLIVLI